MLEPDNSNTVNDSAGANSPDSASTPRKAAPRAPRKRAPKAAAPEAVTPEAVTPEAEDGSSAAARPRKAAAKTTAKKAAKKAAAEPEADQSTPEATLAAPDSPQRATAKKAKKAPAKRATNPAGAAATDQVDTTPPPPAMAAPSVLFVAPEIAVTPVRQRRAAKSVAGPPPISEPVPAGIDLTAIEDVEDQTAEPDDVREAAVEEATGARRRRRRGRRGRGGGNRPAGGPEDDAEDDSDSGEVEGGAAVAASGSAARTSTADGASGEDGADGEDGAATHRRRRRRRSSGGADAEPSETSEDLPPNTVVHVRPPREKSEGDGVKGVKGSTRLEAKRQRRRDGRETTRRRPPILTEAEFLARREAVDRVMAVRQNGERTQIAVLEDDVLVEHYVTRASATSYVGNVYLGRVQNVLPSMEAAFVDIGKGRNGVLYAGEVNWDAAGLEGKSRAIEHALKSGDVVLVQVTKDPIGHKGARLTSQVSLPGRFLVYVPGGGMTGISRKLPDTERHRLKAILKKIVPEDAGVIVRTAAEGATEEELTRDVERLQAQWQTISKKAEKTSAAPTLVHGEPDLAIRVVRDVFNEDFKKLIVQGEDAWDTISDYVAGVAPDLADRVVRHTGQPDVFHAVRVDEQLMKALDRKVWLPSGGSLVIDRTEAMTVIDVNTGKFVGEGGNLEQTVTRNNLEAAEEIVRQLRLRDVGGIVVIDFIDMVLESNRDLVLRRLTECLGRDRTKHQVAEVTSLGLVQMTRKRVGEGLLEAFSEPCEHCKGRGVILHPEPVDRPESSQQDSDDDRPKTRRKRGATSKVAAPTPEELADAEEQRRAALAAISAIHRAAHPDDAEAAEAAAAAEFAAIEHDVDALSSIVEQVQADDRPSTAPEPAIEAASAADTMTGPDLAWEPHRAAEAEAEPEPERESEPESFVAAEYASYAEPEVRVAAPRRRRAASRPAGPPTVAAQG